MFLELQIVGQYWLKHKSFMRFVLASTVHINTAALVVITLLFKLYALRHWSTKLH